jgi:hypothetical protein
MGQGTGDTDGHNDPDNSVRWLRNLGVRDDAAGPGRTAEIPQESGTPPSTGDMDMVVIPAPTPEGVRGLLGLLKDPHQWLRRRTDEAELLDLDRVRWKTRVEIELPSATSARVGWGCRHPRFFNGAGRAKRNAVIVLPLFNKLKGDRHSTGFAVTDSAGAIVSPLTFDENVRWMQATAVQVIRDALRPRIPLKRISDLGRRLGGPHFQESRDATSELFAWALYGGGSPRAQLSEYANVLRRLPPSTAEAEQAVALVSNDQALSLLAGMVYSYYLLVPVLNEPGKNLAFVVDHEDLIHPKHEPQSAGEIHFPIGAAKSYHARIRVPTGVMLRQTVSIEMPSDLDPPEPYESSLQMFYSEASPAAEAVWTDIRGSLGLGRGGVKWPARGLGIATPAAFGLGLALRAGGAVPVSGSAALLVAALSITAGAVLQREAWEVQRQVSRSSQVTLVLVIVAAAIGAGALVVNWPPDTLRTVHGFAVHWRSVVWALGGIVAGVAGAIATLTWLRDR